MYLVGVVTLVVVTVKCLQDESDLVFDGLVIVCNVSRLVGPIMVLGVIVGHPELRMVTVVRWMAKISGYKRRLRNRNNKNDSNNDSNISNSSNNSHSNNKNNV